LRMARVGVLPSEREGLARVVIQYTLSGLPVVATHTQGIEQIVTEGESGYLVPVDDVAAMAVPIQQLLQDKALHDAMAQAAREKDLSAWSADHMVTEIEKIYRLHARG
ncbi:MAG: glycosyltransferase, partial [Rickettsiales bacterium]|nr:glycosyltransferase [Rickettsiales bacterium]